MPLSQTDIIDFIGLEKLREEQCSSMGQMFTGTLGCSTRQAQRQLPAVRRPARTTAWPATRLPGM